MYYFIFLAEALNILTCLLRGGSGWPPADLRRSETGYGSLTSWRWERHGRPFFVYTSPPFIYYYDYDDHYYRSFLSLCLSLSLSFSDLETGLNDGPCFSRPLFQRAAGNGRVTAAAAAAVTRSHLWRIAPHFRELVWNGYWHAVGLFIARCLCRGSHNAWAPA